MTQHGHTCHSEGAPSGETRREGRIHSARTSASHFECSGGALGANLPEKMALGPPHRPWGLLLRQMRHAVGGASSQPTEADFGSAPDLLNFASQQAPPPTLPPFAGQTICGGEGARGCSSTQHAAG
jgi:hypothetical protein